MRILYVINSLDGGGAALPLLAVIGLMRAAGHEVRVVSLMERDGRGRAALDAAAIAYDVIGGARRAPLRSFVRLGRLADAWRPDLLWTSLTHATIAGEALGRVTGIPVVSWLHNAWLKPANAAILRRTAGWTRHWVADSDTVAAFGTARLGIAADRISVWPLYRARRDVPVAAPHRAGRFRLGSLGRLHPNKGYDVLIEAMALLRARAPELFARLDVLIAGEGAARDALERRAGDAGLRNLRFQGFVPHPEHFLGSLHGYVQPSHHEGFCIAAHEAMAAGLPLIVSDVGEMARSVSAAGAGWLLPYGAPARLAEALAEMIAGTEQSWWMGQCGRAWVLDAYSEARFTAQGLAALRAAGLG